MQNGSPAEIRTPISWVRTRCRCQLDDGGMNLAYSLGIEPSTGELTARCYQPDQLGAQIGCGGGNRTHLVVAYEATECASSTSPHQILARPEGLEPPTSCLEGTCSIQLSYERELAYPERIELSTRELTAHRSATELRVR